MRINWALGVFFLSGAFSLADSVTENSLKEFALRYANAVQSRDVPKIETFWLPALFKTSNRTDKATIDRWETALKGGILPPSDPVWIKVKAFDSNSQVMAWGKWLAQPIYQIEIQSHHSSNGGEEGGAELAEAVGEQSGNFYIIRPLSK